jgi:hypothetical protein
MLGRDGDARDTRHRHGPPAEPLAHRDAQQAGQHGVTRAQDAHLIGAGALQPAARILRRPVDGLAGDGGDGVHVVPVARRAVALRRLCRRVGHRHASRSRRAGASGRL